MRLSIPKPTPPQCLKKSKKLGNEKYVDLPANTLSPQNLTQLYISNTMKLPQIEISEERHPTIKHVSNTCNVASDWLLMTILNVKIQIKINMLTLETARKHSNEKNCQSVYSILRFFSMFFLFSILFFQTINFKKGTSCQNEVKRQLRTTIF